MAKLTAKTRNELPKSDFAVPSKRAYPVEDKAHARNALARVAQNGSAREKEEGRKKVEGKFSGIGKKGK
jgi:hypothetical protein